jgi:hypothetical protein
MSSNFAENEGNVRISFMRTVLVYFLLCGVTIATQTGDQKAGDGPISMKLGDVFEKGKIKTGYL